ncbi:MAG: MSMEG_4193 family putative phosphomutase [Anaerolineae bacterium]|nr:MSMEG_4193 family putative phosphomutase [Anaerolineae bacterium]
MTDFLLVRHAINDWVKTGRLAGWTPGVHLNPDGQAQAQALGEHLAKTPLVAIYSSPLERTMETAEAIAAHHPKLRVQSLDDVGEVRYGQWQGKKLSHLRREKMWHTVQVYPSRAHFPGGEAIRQAQSRAVDALETLVAKHPTDRVVVVSHSDIIKLMVAHYLGAHLDMFQRIEISPASLTLIRLGANRPTIMRVNDTSYLPPANHRPARPSRWGRVRKIIHL